MVKNMYLPVSLVHIFQFWSQGSLLPVFGEGIRNLLNLATQVFSFLGTVRRKNNPESSFCEINQSGYKSTTW